MFDGNFAAAPQQPMGGYYYNGFQGQPAPVQKINNILTKEQIDKLTQNAEFKIGLTEEELLRALCNHRTPEGDRDTLVYDPATGVARCTICGYQFRPVQQNESPEDIKQAVERLVDILQTIKIMYQDLPENAHKEFFPVIAMIEKIPALFEFAAKNFAKHETNNWQYSRYNMNGIQQLNNLSAIFANGGMYAQPQMQQPMMGQPQWQPAPMMQPQMQAAPAGMNPFGYPGAGQPNPAFGGFGGYQPQGYAGFTPQPAQATTPVTPTVAADAATPATEVSKTVKV